MIAPTTSGVIYYTGPSEDFARPGRMWWSVPADVTGFSTWRELTTIYHEGVPGHHLQIAQTVYRSDSLNRWRRLGAWSSGHGEGWALYAERLGKEVGFYQEPTSDLGRLQSEIFRACRLVVDTGVHAKHWTRDQMLRFFEDHYGDPDPVEIDRYIAWPAQALGYKLGQLEILELRDRAQQELGAKFDIKAFHDEILGAGPLPLEVLDARVRQWIARQKH